MNTRIIAIGAVALLGLAACGSETKEGTYLDGETTETSEDPSEEFRAYFYEQHADDLDRAGNLFGAISSDITDMDIQGATRNSDELHDLFVEMLTTAEDAPGNGSKLGTATIDMATVCEAALALTTQALTDLDIDQLNIATVRIQDCNAQLADAVAAVPV